MEITLEDWDIYFISVGINVSLLSLKVKCPENTAVQPLLYVKIFVDFIIIGKTPPYGYSPSYACKPT